MDSPFQEVPQTPFLDKWTSFHDNHSPAAIVPSGSEHQYQGSNGSMATGSMVTPQHNSSPFVPPECSSGLGLDRTPNQRRSRSVMNKTPRPRSSLTKEQVVPSTPNQPVRKDYEFSTPKSTPRRSYHSQYVSMETSQRSRMENEKTPKGETEEPDVIIIDETGDHHSSVIKVQKGLKREDVARQRKISMSRGSVKTRLTSDFLDEIVGSDKQ